MEISFNFTDLKLGVDRIFVDTFGFKDFQLYLYQQIVLILDHLLISVVVYVLLCLCLYRIIFRWRFVTTKRFPDKFKRILVVTAHPDDECMFFGPTILSLCRRKACQVYLLCISNGNFDKKGHLRRLELWNSCKKLEMWAENIVMCNVTDLQDDPNVDWDLDKLGKIIKKYVEVLDIQAIVTFDRDGVSRHSNHINIYYAITSLFLTNRLKEKACKLFTLDTINIIRKYMLVFDLPITFLLSTNWFVLNWSDFRIIRAAMKQHKSQMMWFRKLYILFSRYMIINSLKEINIADIELDMQLL